MKKILTIILCALAATAGAVMIEKHVTLDPFASGPDHHMSLPIKALGHYVNGVRYASLMLGSPAKRVLKCEEKHMQRKQKYEDSDN